MVCWPSQNSSRWAHRFENWFQEPLSGFCHWNGPLSHFECSKTNVFLVVCIFRSAPCWAGWNWGDGNFEGLWFKPQAGIHARRFTGMSGRMAGCVKTGKGCWHNNPTVAVKFSWIRAYSPSDGIFWGSGVDPQPARSHAHSRVARRYSDGRVADLKRSGGDVGNVQSVATNLGRWRCNAGRCRQMQA